jgi:flavin-binding protein dodecin
VSNRTYALSEIVGTSTEGVSEAIRNGVSRADEALRHIDWFEVTDVRGHVVDGEVAHYQVTMKVGYRLEER